MEEMTNQQKAVLEAMSLGVNVFTAVAAYEATMVEYNFWHTNDSFRELSRQAEQDGKERLGRIERMRKIVSQHDEALEIIEEKAERYRAWRKHQSSIQLGLIR